MDCGCAEVFCLSSPPGVPDSGVFQRTGLNVFMALSSAVLEAAKDLHPAVVGDFPRGDLTTLALTDTARLVEARECLVEKHAREHVRVLAAFPCRTCARGLFGTTRA